MHDVLFPALNAEPTSLPTFATTLHPNPMSTTQPSSIEENEIILGTGMGPLRFGATMDEVRTLVGEPEEIEESDDDAEFEHKEWIYHEDEYLVSLYFDREDDFRLSCIETDNPNMRLFGEAIHGAAFFAGGGPGRRASPARRETAGRVRPTASS